MPRRRRDRGARRRDALTSAGQVNAITGEVNAITGEVNAITGEVIAITPEVNAITPEVNAFPLGGRGASALLGLGRRRAVRRACRLGAEHDQDGLDGAPRHAR